MGREEWKNNVSKSVFEVFVKVEVSNDLKKFGIYNLKYDLLSHLLFSHKISSILTKETYHYTF